MKEIISYFLKIGLLGFGGPMAHIAMMDEELVEKRKWTSKEQFLEGLAVCQILPGPASTQLGIYLGYLRGGISGGLLAGFCFILPAFVIITFLSYLYFQYGTIPQMKGLLYGINAMVVALIGNSLYKMGKSSIKDRAGIGIMALSAAAIFLWKINLLVVLVAGGLAGISIYYQWPKTKKNYITLLPLALAEPTLWKLFAFFLKVGSFIYGGGLVIIPFIEQEIVEKLGWMTRQEFLAGLSFGQITPGPVVITSAFIGYKVFGVLGAAVAALGIFAPSFVFILIATPYLAKIREIPWVKGFLTGINAAVIGAILASVLQLIPTAIVDVWTLAIGIAGFVALWKYKVNSFYAIAASAVAGLGITYLFSL
ncbi:chromate efflux transporter [Thermotalea metallivorans]|uniref:Putative chromate transport protein n=1 Tax=Thermotalea metallivorans TaxID=520762 RepID=A0A140L7R8_9FIRM|nr:chromate efflux transporter [Thermotalea metallivorans]KXG76593.1 putative chromate transport protein [Thermotalea metallivorans]